MTRSMFKNLVVITSGICAAFTTQNVLANNTTPSNKLQSAVTFIGSAAIGVAVSQAVKTAVSAEFDETASALNK